MPAGEDKQSKRLPPSARKLREARLFGQSPRSPDISGWAVVLVASYAIPLLFGLASARIVGLLGAGVAGFSDPTNATALRDMGQGLYVLLTVVVIATAAALLVALVSHAAQGRPAFAWKKMKPSLSHLSPASGAKKMFSASGLTHMAKQTATLVLVTVIAVSIVSKLLGLMSVGTVVPLGAVISTLVPQVFLLLRYVALAGLMVGVADWWAQRHRISQELKMTPKEAKDEARQEEGSPEARSGRRRAALKLYRSRMAGTVQWADVLVVNPTHYAVGLSYRTGVDNAPRVVARGSGDVAARLRSDAQRTGIPVVTDPPVARALYSACLVGDTVPVKLYEAVAKLLAQVYSLRT